MRNFAKNAARPWGFTLIELLTVVAIIGVLATLLASSLSTAKRKARKTVSISNLRQISLALNLYQDDHRKRPLLFASMVREKYLSERSLVCAEDRLTGNWAGLIEDPGLVFVSRVPTSSERVEEPIEAPHSYFKSFDSSDEVWERIEKSPLAGVAACQLHGLGRQHPDIPPSITAYQGLVLRGLKDTTVVSRQVFWDNSEEKSGAPPGAPSMSLVPGRATSDLPLFLDDQE